MGNFYWEWKSWYFYPIFLAVAVAIWGPVVSDIRSVNAQNEERHRAVTPLLTRAELTLELDKVYAEQKRHPTDNASDYYTLLETTWTYQALIRRHLDSIPFFEEVAHIEGEMNARQLELRTMPLQDTLNGIQQQYMDKFGGDHMRKLADAHPRGLYDPFPYEQVTYATVWPLASTAYWQMALLMIAFFAVRLHRYEFPIAVELLFRGSLLALFWPATIFLYPSRVNPASATKNAIFVMSMLASAGLAGAATAQVKQVKKSSGNKRATPQQVVNTIESGEQAFLNLHGWAQAGFTESLDDKTISDEGFGLRQLQVRGTGMLAKNLGFFTQTNLVELTAERAAALKEAWLSYTWDGLKVRLGRTFLAGASPAPAPFALATVTDPRVPFHFFGTGIRADYEVGELSLAADLTFGTGTPLGDPNQFDSWGMSAKADYQLLESLSVTATVQAAREHVRTMLATTWNPRTDFAVQGALYYADERSELPDVYGGYALIAHDVLDWLEAHAQVDVQNTGSLLTGGIRLKTSKERLSFTVDYVHDTATHGDELQARFQFRF